MFCDRPLTWLFIAATVVIDCVLMSIEATASPNITDSVKLGFVLGQLAATAIWAVRGNLHRLKRLSCLVVTTGLLAYLIRVDPMPIPSWIAFHSGFVTLIVLATVMSDHIRYGFRARTEGDDRLKRWQMPLIEIFGWTIVVAVISLGIRQMNFDFLYEDVLGIIISLFVVPVFLAMLTQGGLRDIGIFKAVMFVAVAIIATSALGRERGGEVAVIVPIQAAYLVLWLAVQGWDSDFSQARNGQADPPEPPSIPESPSINDAPRLFEPQDGSLAFCHRTTRFHPHIGRHIL